jgi:2-dehydropantoate 2-reductase
VPLLNGIEHVALLRTRYADVLAAAIAVESERLEVGHIRQKFPFVSVSLAPHPAAEAIGRELVDAGIDCAEATDEATVLWRKMAFLAPVALTTSALGAPLGAVRADPPWGERLDSCREEVIAAARAEGAGIDAAVLRALHHHRAPDDLQSSMQKDLAAGRPVELDAIGGSVVRTAQRHGQLVPVTEELIDLVSARVAG